MNTPSIALGLSDFEEMRTEGHFYIDKSLLIEELMQDDNKVVLLPRPRRFGKTLNLSMLSYFFDCQKDYSHLFEGLAIAQSSAWTHRGKYPVVFITLKGCKAPDWPMMETRLAAAVEEMVRPHKHLLDNEELWEGKEREEFTALYYKDAPIDVMQNSIKLLTRLLERHHGIKPIVLIDEYDTPLIEAYNRGYYQPMRDVLQVLLGDGLKDNKHLGKAVITGILRVAKESLFSGLNNLTVSTVLNAAYATRFGFTPEEVREGLGVMGLGEHYEAVNNWYNGYLFGGQQIYNPWSILNYLQKPAEGFKPYWVNTSENSLIFHQLRLSPAGTLRQMQGLLEGQALKTPLKDHTVFSDLEHPDNKALFTFLVFSGYLKAKPVEDLGYRPQFELAVPNQEVALVYQELFERFLEGPLTETRAHDLAQYLLAGEMVYFAELLEEYVMAAFDTLDLPKEGAQATEQLYHSFMLGVLAYLHPTHVIRSNQAMGLGRADMTIVPRDANDQRAYVLEFKRVKTAAELEAAAQEALAQIADRQYVAPLLAEGRQVHQVALAFCGKQVFMAYKPG